MKTKADYKLALKIVGAVIDHWDPYALLDGGCPKHEFESEIATVVAQVPCIHSAQDAARAISQVFSSAFQLEGFAPENCVEVGAELFEALSAHGLIGNVDRHINVASAVKRRGE